MTATVGVKFSWPSIAGMVSPIKTVHACHQMSRSQRRGVIRELHKGRWKPLGIFTVPGALAVKSLSSKKG